MTRRGTVLVAVLLVSSAVLPFVAMGQTADNEYQQSFAGQPNTVGVDISNVSGELTVEIGTESGPGTGYQPLVRETYDTASVDRQYIAMSNDAYESMTVTVTLGDGATGEPVIVDGSDMGALATIKETPRATDTDLTCDPGERINMVVSPLTPNEVECSALPGSTNVNTTGSDAQQVEIDMYAAANQQNRSTENHLTTISNRLTDARTMALIIGKNAYIRSLNNGSSQSVATSEAKNAVDEYYSKIQYNIIQQWRLQIAQGEYMSNVAANESGVSNNFPKNVDHTNSGSYTLDSVDYVHYNHGSETVTLANGTSMSVPYARAEYQMSYTGSASGRYVEFSMINGKSTNDDDVTVHGLSVRAPNSNYDRMRYLYPQPFTGAWDRTVQQNSAAKTQIDTLISNTYSEYQAGEINNSDLIDPYVLQQQFSPGENYQGWAATQLTMLGANSPETMDSLGRFNVSAESGDYTGILMSQENPASGQFETNTTYNPSQINGTQYVVTDSEVQELTTNFTITSIETTNGETRQNVTIRETTYETADVNTTEMSQMYEDLAYMRAQWEAREQNLGSGGGGGLFGGGSINQTVALVALAALAGAALIGRA